MYQVPLTVYEQLKKATPEEKRDIVLSLIEEHPDHRLELPMRDGVRADLAFVDLSREALQEMMERRGGVTPLGWDPNLRGAHLEQANLQGADLFRASLQGAILFDANLQGTILWCTNLRGAKLWDAKLQDAFLVNADLQGAQLIDANLRGAKLIDANLQGAKLWRAKLQGARLSPANLQGAELNGADLQGAKLWGADLERANLRGAELQGVDLSQSKIGHCYLSGTWLDRTRLRREQLGGAVGEELDGDYTEAKLAYLGLKQNFDTLGDYAASSWAYRKERRMEKREALERARDARARRDWKEALSSYTRVLSDQMVELVCDYGEGVGRVLGCLALLWLGFALFYGITRHVRIDSGLKHITRNVIDLLSFSLATMVTLEAPGLYVYPTWAIRILMPLQAALGIFFLGLLGFVAGNRIRRS